jgi:hypothetical protein
VNKNVWKAKLGENGKCSVDWFIADEIGMSTNNGGCCIFPNLCDAKHFISKTNLRFYLKLIAKEFISTVISSWHKHIQHIKSLEKSNPRLFVIIILCWSSVVRHLSDVCKLQLSPWKPMGEKESILAVMVFGKVRFRFVQMKSILPGEWLFMGTKMSKLSKSWKISFQVRWAKNAKM